MLSTFKVTAGYAPGGSRVAAVWTTVDVSSCGRQANETSAITLTVKNTATGQVEFQFGPWYILPGQLPVIDDDSARLLTKYQVEVQVKSTVTGQLLDSGVATITTPKGKGTP